MSIAIPAIMPTADRHAQMAIACKSGFPFLRKLPPSTDLGAISIICYGPSLLETWQDINRTDYLPMMTVSGAHDFLMERGLTPSFHVHLDPRPYELEMLQAANAHTRYLMASVCPEGFWEVLKGKNVELWHMINGEETVEWVRMNHSRGLKSMIGGGSTVGQRAINVANALGYRKFRVFGMDCSFGYQHWSGPHPGNNEPIIHVELAGKTFKTTPHLWQAAREMAEFLETTPIDIEFHGSGLMQTVAASIQRKRKV